MFKCQPVCCMGYKNRSKPEAFKGWCFITLVFWRSKQPSQAEMSEAKRCRNFTSAPSTPGNLSGSGCFIITKVTHHWKPSLTSQWMENATNIHLDFPNRCSRKQISVPTCPLMFFVTVRVFFCVCVWQGLSSNTGSSVSSGPEGHWGLVKKIKFYSTMKVAQVQ